MRDLYMKSGQGFLLVFSITSPSSLSELASLREEIIRIKDDDDDDDNEASIPMVIVGNKADLEEARAVSRAKAFSVAQSWGAPYYESSARTRTNVDEVFTDLCRQMLRKDDRYTSSAPVPSDLKVDSTLRERRKRSRRPRTREHGHQRCTIL
ncbi:hypothetical protein CP532_6177 [Ophiocordyceps camponoti-leonardi (nom. inval.)]|nr:hypothetical protein CP532_6177 [Ophiocordyceps camponoti-leonardi (nom. inval.)]